MVLCRAGYSTLMDLAFFGKKAIFVPTPGQTEQIYLADQLHEANMGTTVSQDKLILEVAIKKRKLLQVCLSINQILGRIYLWTQ